MLKLLRQYNQWILVVGGTLLLITFLMPSAIQGLAQRSAVSGATWATYSGGSITGADREQAQQELRVLEVIGNRTLNNLGAAKDPAHWWLLVHEARDSGLVGGEAEGEAVLRQMAASGGATPEQALVNLIRASGTNRDTVLTALGKLQGVTTMLSLSTNVDRVSDPRLKRAVARSLLSVSGDLVVLDARKNEKLDAAVPTDAELEEQLKKFADKARPADAAIGKDKFGYRMPDRFKIEWLTLSKSSISAGIVDSPELTTLALKKRFAQDPKKYGATDAGGFAAAEASVRSKVTEELVKARLDEIAKFSGDQLSLAQRGLKRDGAHFALPADWTTQMPSLQALAQTVASEFKIAAPTYQSSGESWLNSETLRTTPGLGTARTNKFGQFTSTSQLVDGLKELSKPSMAAPVQVNIASPAMTTDTGDICFFRVIAAEPSKPATDLAAVRADVEKDLRSLGRFAWLEANKDAIAAQATTDGIRAVAERFGTTVEFAKDVQETSEQFLSMGFRMSMGLQAVGNDPKAIAAIVERASKIPFSADMTKVPAADRTIAVILPDTLSLAVMQVTSMKPVTEERFNTITAPINSTGGSGVVRATADPELAIDPSSLFSMDALKSRYGFKLSGERNSSETATAAQPSADSEG